MLPPQVIPAPRRAYRKRKFIRTTPAPVALVLQSASYADSEYVELTFDRAVDASGLVAGQIVVNDGLISGFKWLGNGPVTVISPATIRIELTDDGEAEPPALLLDATSATGIVAVDDGGTWAGVTDYVPSV